MAIRSTSWATPARCISMPRKNRHSAMDPRDFGQDPYDRNRDLHLVADRVRRRRELCDQDSRRRPIARTGSNIGNRSASTAGAGSLPTPATAPRSGWRARSTSISGADDTQLLDMTPGTGSFVDAALLAGQSYTDSTYGVTITVGSASPTSLDVTVAMGAGSPTTTTLVELGQPIGARRERDVHRQRHRQRADGHGQFHRRRQFDRRLQRGRRWPVRAIRAPRSARPAR